MKKLYLVFFLLYLCISANSQELKLRPKFFTLHNARISTGFGYEMSIAEDNGGALYEFKGAKPESAKVSFVDNTITDTVKVPYLSLSIPFDLYAPNSFLGFYTEISYSLYKWNLRYDSLSHLEADRFKFNMLEIPFYLKLRPGSVSDTKTHFWFLLGGAYSIPVSSSTNLSSSSPKMFSSFPSVGGAVGMEMYFSRGKTTYKFLADQYRLVFYIRGNYSLQNKFNNNYFQANYVGSRQGIDYSKVELKDLIISFGFKFLFRLNQPGEN